MIQLSLTAFMQYLQQLSRDEQHLLHDANWTQQSKIGLKFCNNNDIILATDR